MIDIKFATSIFFFCLKLASERVDFHTTFQDYRFLVFFCFAFTINCVYFAIAQEIKLNKFGEFCGGFHYRLKMNMLTNTSVIKIF